MTARLSCLLSLCAGLLFGLDAGTAIAQSERITSFDSQIMIRADGVLEVKETISVFARGEQIRRGIFREFPTVRGRTWRGPFRVSFDVINVRRNGLPEPWFIQRGNESARLYIGDQNAFVPLGHHTYEIIYQTDRQIGFFDTHDELYWNVTGHFWSFPIERATATITGPAGVRPTNTNVFTGPFGATGRDATTAIGDDNSVSVTGTKIFQAREGLTVAVAWPSGTIVQPDWRKQLTYVMRDGRGATVGLAGLLLVCVYFTWVWFHHGKDPDPGTIIAQYTPPDGMGAAACRYVTTMGWDPRGFTAAIVNMAVKGFLTIEDFETDKYKIRKTGKSANACSLSPGEAAVADGLFGKDWQSLVLREQNSSHVIKARDALRKTLQTDYKNVLFLQNKSLFRVGVVLSIAIPIVLLIAEPFQIGSVFFGLALGGIAYLIHILRMDFASGKAQIINLIASASSFLIFIVLAAFYAPRLLFSGIVFVTTTPNLWSGFWDGLAGAAASPVPYILCALTVMNLVFFRALRAPTHAGQSVMAHLDGLRHYMTVAEKDRMTFHNPPELTPEIFESLLPYAIALDVEEQWGAQFNAALSRLSVAPTQGVAVSYTPDWYTGTRFDRRDYSQFSTGFASGFANGVAASVMPPSNMGSWVSAPGSSGGFRGGGFGGGGFSGGGGGGGGGGGW